MAASPTHFSRAALCPRGMNWGNRIQDDAATMMYSRRQNLTRGPAPTCWSAWAVLAGVSR